MAQDPKPDDATLKRWAEAYGSDPRRWPQPVPADLSHIGDDTAASLMEAGQLDAILERHGRDVVAQADEHETLAKAIMAKVAASGGVQGDTDAQSQSTVIVLPASASSTAIASGMGTSRRGAGSGRLSTAALLAACLVLGVTLGASQTTGDLSREIASSMGLSVMDQQIAGTGSLFGEAADELL